MMTFYPTIRVKRVNPDAPLPTKAHPSDAAYDLCAMEDVTLRPGEFKMVGSGLAFSIPQGWCGAVYPRSGLGCKGLVLKNTVGLIDAHYRGEVMLPLFNNNPTHTWEYGITDEQKEVVREALGGYGDLLVRMNDDSVPYIKRNFDGTIHIHKGDRVAQMRIELVPESTMMEVDELDDTDRGVSGFGASGVRGDRL